MSVKCMGEQRKMIIAYSYDYFEYLEFGIALVFVFLFIKVI